MAGGRFCCGSGREEGGGRREESGSRNGWLGVVMGMVREEGGGRREESDLVFGGWRWWWDVEGGGRVGCLVAVTGVCSLL
jgi:hypothetical protein